MTIENAGPSSFLGIDNSADTSGQYVTLTPTSLSVLGSAAISWGASGLSSLWIEGGAATTPTR